MSGISGSVEQMTQGHLRNVQQLAVFYTGHNNIYAINIAKVKAFIITEEVAINDTQKIQMLLQELQLLEVNL